MVVTILNSTGSEVPQDTVSYTTFVAVGQRCLDVPQGPYRLRSYDRQRQLR